MKNNFHHRTGVGRRSLGVTIIELMISLLIGMVIIAAVTYVFFGSRQTSRSNDMLARIQENGRIALSAVSDSVRMAGFSGCRSLDSLTQANNTGGALNFLLDSNGNPSYISGHSYTSTDPIAGANGATGSDIITLQYMSTSAARLSKDMTSPSDDLVFAKTAYTPNFTVGQYAVIASCSNMDIFKVTAVTATTSTITVSHAALSTSYSTVKGRIGSAVEMTYYVRQTGRTNTQGEPIYGLFRQPTVNGAAVAGATEDELAEGIDKMVVSYGIDTNNDGNVDQYVATSAMTSTYWPNVASVRIQFLVSSTDNNILDSAQSYTFNGNTITDRKLHTNVGSTITLRNRVQ